VCCSLFSDFPRCADTPITAAHGPAALPGAVVYPRSTEDVVRLVKIASKHAIPLIPYCAGTSLEGHTTAIGYANNPSEKQVQEKLAKGEQVVLADLVPGLALVVDFAENMNQIISLNAQDLDAVVQPFVLFFPLSSLRS
jgi:D-lactate dehydrogenase (cytochrome)